MMQLQVHLEHKQFIVFDKNDTDAIHQPQDTHLTAFFKVNTLYPEAHSVTYPDFPSKSRGMLLKDNGVLGKQETHLAAWYLSLLMRAKSFMLGHCYRW